MLKFLIGGSPCTNWSIAQKHRETTASGEGWELFLNYVLAKQRFKPDFFLYENNKSAADEIKKQISTELAAPLQYINSGLVSAQNRERFYCHNLGNVPQPEDRRILVQDILESNRQGIDYGAIAVDYNLHKNCEIVITQNFMRQARLDRNGSTVQGQHVTFLDGKTQTLNTNHIPMIFESMPTKPIKVGGFPSKGKLKYRQGEVLYSEKGKAICLTANGGGVGGNSGLYIMPFDSSSKCRPVYRVVNGKIAIKGKLYPIKIQDGLYIIRKLTVAECCRLQTMPDNYCRAVTKTQALKGLGNGWTAEVILHLLSHALKGVPKNEKIVVLSMYDGIGTGRYCFDKLGYHNITYYAYEFDSHAVTVSMSNYPDIKQCGDAYSVRKAGWFLDGI